MGVVAGARWIAKPERGKYVGWSSIPLHSQYGAMSDEAVDGHIPAARRFNPANRPCGDAGTDQGYVLVAHAMSSMK